MMDKVEINLQNKVGKAEAEIRAWSYNVIVDTDLRHEERSNEYNGETLEMAETIFRDLKSSLEKDLEIYNRRDEESDERIYYDLLRLEYKDGFACHIPIPMLFRKYGLEIYTILITMTDDKNERGEDYYSCPNCGQDSFFQGICLNCQRDPDVELSEEYVERNEKKRKRKEKLKRELQKLSVPNRENVEEVLEDVGLESLEYVKGGTKRYGRY